jgi:fumarate reductase flavoprotein subunit
MNHMNIEFEQSKTDVLILGAGGAGLFAALHASNLGPDLNITIAVKGLLGKCGCTRMVQGGYNAAMANEDSIERHFMDTIEGGKWLNNQDLAWTLVNEAPRRIRELENELGCFFDRNPDGSLHQKAFAGQTFDRTVHKGDLTGIEIINRLAEQVWSRGINRLEDHRAVEFVKSKDGSGLAGVLMVDMRTGKFRLVQAKAVLLATGGGPTMYTYHTPSGDKSCDGMAMSLRAGIPLRDMEMVQFHPTGLVAGPETRITGTIIEEGLRGYGGYLLGGDKERFMHKYDAKVERATRDIVSRGMFSEMRNGNVGPNGGLFITMKHLDPKEVRSRFKGMVDRCRDCGFDLVSGDVEVVPTAHYMMGGVEFQSDCLTELPGLFAAGEDTGGVHGANRLGGNGVANSTVFGGIAGDAVAKWVPKEGVFREPDLDAAKAAISAALYPFQIEGGHMPDIRKKLYEVMWEDAGILRDAESLARARVAVDELHSELMRTGVADESRAYNLSWHDWLNLESQIIISKAVIEAAVVRKDSRGAHFREDFPETHDLENSRFTKASLDNGKITITSELVEFTHVRPGETLIND